MVPRNSGASVVAKGNAPVVKLVLTGLSVFQYRLL